MAVMNEVFYFKVVGIASYGVTFPEKFAMRLNI
jgi:hypothetical protein